MSAEDHTYIGFFDVFLKDLGKLNLLVSANYVYQRLDNGRQSCAVKDVSAHINGKWATFTLPPDDLIDDLCKEIYKIHDSRKQS